jgi:hypothetical protein
MKQIVYRVERKDNRRGIYSGMGGLYEISSYSTDSRHPEPERDSLLIASITAAGHRAYTKIETLHYGFVSIDQLRSWLYDDEWLKELSENGFILAEYKSEEVYVGNTQLIFLRGERRHHVHNIMKYFQLTKEEK